MVFSLEFEWEQVSSSLQDLLSILAVLNNAVFKMVSTRPPNSKFVSLSFETVPKAPIAIGIIVTFCSIYLFNSLARSRYVCFFSRSFNFILLLAGAAKSTILQILFFLLIIIRSGLLAEIRWSVRMSKSHRSLYVSFSWRDAGFCVYHLLVWWNWNFLHISQWITLPTQSCLVLYSYANLLHLFYYYYICFIIITIYSLRVFHISFSWWSFTGVSVIASLPKSPGFFSLRNFHMSVRW